MRIFREHNKEAAAWAVKGTRRERKNWEDEEGVVWPDVRGICMFGSCPAIGCGAGTWVKVLTLSLGWLTVNNN